MNRPLVVSINSVSGGGKTALAAALHRSLPESALFRFDDFDDTNVYPEDFHEWSRRGADMTAFDCPGMRKAVDEEIRRGKARQILLDYPLGRRHPRFAGVIDLAVFIDTPLDVAMARRILRDGPGKASAEDALKHLRSELTHYLAKGRSPYLDAFRDREASDLVLDGTRGLDALTREILDRIGSARKS